MLVLTRQRDQTIMIGDDVEITVVDIRGDKVRLGINAPRSVVVHRKEVYDHIRAENQAAARLKVQDLANVPAVPPEPKHLEPSNGPFPRLAQGDENKNKSKIKDTFLLAAIDEARIGLSEGGLPIGSVLVRNHQIIGRGHNRRVQRGDPMAHAEIDCLTNAGRQKTYGDTVLYSTLMPCHLCSGAAVQFGIPKVIVGESVNFAGAPEFMRSKGIEVVDLHDQECIEMMAQFIREHPELWNEDIGR
ncbi:MAG: carbon storage regulator CsrA [Tepidisphaeraceae bacterium]|jgi:cytosine deaminase